MEKESADQVVDSDAVAKEWLGSCSDILSRNGVDSSLSFVCRREYTIECNWKVLCYVYLITYVLNINCLPLLMTSYEY